MRIAMVLLAACGATSPSPAPKPAPTPAPAPVTQTTNGSDFIGGVTVIELCKDKDACHHEAEELEGEGDFAGAAVPYGRACDFGDGGSCFALGLVVRGRIQPPDDAGSHDAFAKACDLGIADGCAQTGTDLLTGIGVAEDHAAGRALLERACSAGSGLSCYNLGVSAREGTFGAAKDAKAAYALFEKGCAGGSGPACTEQAIALLDGKAVKRDTKRATVLAEQACAASAAQCYLRAELYQKEKRHTEARALYDKACGARSAVGCHNLGVMLQTGVGGPKDINRANDVFTTACGLGMTKSCGRGECISGFEDACKPGLPRKSR